MINPKTQRFMAERMKATIRSSSGDHTPLLTAPDEVATAKRTRQRWVEAVAAPNLAETKRRMDERSGTARGV
jgi:hypothetical protein